MTTTTKADETLVWMYVKGLENALRAYYNQHQATGCKCELCKTPNSYSLGVAQQWKQKSRSLTND
jgi:hypothetical protein